MGLWLHSTIAIKNPYPPPMNWLKDNKFLVAAGVAVLIAVVSLAFFAGVAAHSHDEALATYNAEVQQLDALKKQIPYPSKGNLKAINKQSASYNDAFSALQSTLTDLDAPVDNTITPQVFQDELRKSVDSLVSKANKNTVALPETFYLGFDEFRTRLPSKDEAVTLNPEFKVLNTLLNQLVDLKLLSIDSLLRLPQPPSPEGDNSSILKRRFSISFTAPQDKLIAAFNEVSNSKYFLIIRSASFENSNPDPPQKIFSDKIMQPGTPPRPLRPIQQINQKDAVDTHLHVVVGNEIVTSTLVVEIPTFPDLAKESTTSKPKP